MFGRLSRSRILRPVDDQPVWSITCLFVSREYRRHGHSQGIIRASAQYAKERGARIVEAYPVEPRTSFMPDAFAGMGIADAFRKAGFHEVARRSATRPIMRWRATDANVCDS